MGFTEVLEMVSLLKKSTVLTPQQWTRLSRVRVAFANGMWNDGNSGASNSNDGALADMINGLAKKVSFQVLLHFSMKRSALSGSNPEF